MKDKNATLGYVDEEVETTQLSKVSSSAKIGSC